jgi:hypothetical protein
LLFTIQFRKIKGGEELWQKEDSHKYKIQKKDVKLPEKVEWLLMEGEDHEVKIKKQLNAFARV